MEAKPPNDAMRRRTAQADAAPRCGARTRGGSPCRQAAVRGKRRCRMHGGAAGSGAQPGNANALKHGRGTAEVESLRKLVRELVRRSRELAGEV